MHGHDDGDTSWSLRAQRSIHTLVIRETLTPPLRNARRFRARRRSRGPPVLGGCPRTPESVVAAGTKGYHLMLVPFAGPKMKEGLDAYRAAWAQAGHPGRGKVALGFHLLCHESRDEGARIVRADVKRYFALLVAAMELGAGWGQGTSTILLEEAQRSMRFFAVAVIPHFRSATPE